MYIEFKNTLTNSARYYSVPVGHHHWNGLCAPGSSQPPSSYASIPKPQEAQITGPWYHPSLFPLA